MPNYQDLQAMYINQQRSERQYWSGLIGVLNDFGEKLVRHLELPTPTYKLGGEDVPYLSIGQVNSLDVYRPFDTNDFDRKERSIPIQVRLAVQGGSNVVRTVSIDMTISAQGNKTSFYSPLFPAEKRSIEYFPSHPTGLLDEIVSALGRQLIES